MPQLLNIAHRPWPLPEGPWIMAQSWRDLLFAHWPVPLAQLRPFIPPELTIDTFEGQAWIGVVPFLMTGVHPRPAPSVPGLSTFPELNVRTYVTTGGKAGVFFFSLDAANRIAVRIARRFYHLPYFDARMSCLSEGDTVLYSSTRIHRNAPPAELIARYHPTSPTYLSQAGTLENWLTERYALYAVDHHKQIYRGEIHHNPWPLQPAEAEFSLNTMILSYQINLPAVPPLLHFARRLDVVVWPLQRLLSLA